MKEIDLRSDTVTKPSEEMREAMLAADVGDDVYGEDPTVNRLEKCSAALLGKEAALFAPSGTQTNLLALMSHCQRGEEYIVGQAAHTYRYEAGGAAVLGSIQPQPLDLENNGTFDLQKVAAAIKPDDYHFARTKLLCLENTHNGLALPMDYLAEAGAFAARHGLFLHLDGARLCNAAIKNRVEPRVIASHFDSVSLCLSKGLGAPVGSILAGSSEFIERARRWRKMLGGGMRQAGILAAAGLYALENNRDRLEQDHEHAARLADGLRQLDCYRVEHTASQTNMVFITPPPGSAPGIRIFLERNGVRVPAGDRLRLVTHLDISGDDIGRVVELFSIAVSETG